MSVAPVVLRAQSETLTVAGKPIEIVVSSVMKWTDRARTLSLELAPGSRMLPPTSRAIEVRLAGETRTRSAKFEGKRVELRV